MDTSEVIVKQEKIEEQEMPPKKKDKKDKEKKDKKKKKEKQEKEEKDIAVAEKDANGVNKSIMTNV
jgi:hypothetical protein